MIREINLEEISDGHLYELNDLVKAGCGDCSGCHACCQGMGISVVLDPLDICRLTNHLGMGFDELLSAGNIGMHVEEGVILPNLNMEGPGERCAFLDENGRCSIHCVRPGICRIFPLGRYYEEHGFRYFLQVHECPREHKSKVKVRKWIDTPDARQNEQFILRWHDYVRHAKDMAGRASNEEEMKQISLYILNRFYRMPFGRADNFYGHFFQRLEEAYGDERREDR